MVDTARARDRGDETLVQWLTRSQGWLYGHILTLLPDPEAARDVLQETNLVIWRKRLEFDPDQGFLGWAARIAHFQVLAHWRDSGRDRHVFTGEMMELLAEESLAEDGDLASARRSVALRRCLERLPDRDRDLILTRYSPDMTVQSMAEQLGKTANAVSRSLYRIRSLLELCIERQAADSGP